MESAVKQESSFLLCYTRQPQEEDIYAPKLAYSMHLAYSEDGLHFRELNHNSGLLFALATQNENGTLTAKSLKNPYLFRLADGTFGIVAVRTEAGGEQDGASKGSILFFVSSDLLQYKEIGLLDLKGNVFVEDVACEYEAERKAYAIYWRGEDGSWYRNTAADLFDPAGVSTPQGAEPFAWRTVTPEIEGIVPRNMVEVARVLGQRLVHRLTTPTHVATEVPAKIRAAAPGELRNVKAKAVYSDGTIHEKTVDWNVAEADWSRPGSYRVTGTVHQDHFEFPVAVDRADPCMIKWRGMYYFIATNDADSNHTLYIREAATIPDLVHAEEVLILDTVTYGHIKGLLWAPEFHVIEGELYIFHAATSGEFFYEESHVMKLRADGSPACREDWSEPRRVVRQDGSDLCEAGKVISLDMTVIPWNGEYYASWSERQFLPVDLGAWIYIAKLNAREPWRLAGEPVLLTKPDYGWANNHTFVDEGPFALFRDGRLFLTFSSAAVDATYVVGYLLAEAGADLLDPASWTKSNYPILTSRSVPGEFGTGHNSYITDDDGVIWNAYHARPGVKGPRSTGIRRVHFDVDGYPVLGLTEEKDLNPGLAQVSVEVTVAQAAPHESSQILIYTRTPLKDYTESLANSIHLALREGPGEFQPLNGNYGILYAVADIDEHNVIHEKGVKRPCLFRTAEGAFGILAVRVDKDGNEDLDSAGQVLLWTSEDLLTFHCCGLVRLHPEAFVQEAVCEYNEAAQTYEIRWLDQTGQGYVNRLSNLAETGRISPPEAVAVSPEAWSGGNLLPGIIPGNARPIDAQTLAAVKTAWQPLHHTGLRVPDRVAAASPGQVQAVTATAVYSDGSTAEKRVVWDLAGVDFAKPGVYTVNGSVAGCNLSFPLASGYADPVILPWENKYYFLATNDNKNDIGMYVREADTIADLFAPGFKEAVILDVDEERGFIQTFWAPEFHIIGGELYILFAVGGKQWGPQCHAMKLRKGGSIMNAADWHTPERVRRADGSFLTEDGITLDMTYFQSGEGSYLAWSYRKGIGTPLDTGSMLYIASVDEHNPAVLTSEPVLLSRPLLGWENIQGTINNEGPYPLLTEDTVYLTYSGGAATGYTYAVGVLAIPRGEDCLNPANWTKAHTPVLSYYSLEGIYGPGHNSFFQDYDNITYMLYHGEESLVKHGNRCSAMHRVHFDRQGKPVFDVAGDRDVHPELAHCSIQVVVGS